MDSSKESEIKDYIQKKEEATWTTALIDTVADLAWLEKESKKWALSKRLKNDENLLSYADLTMKTEKLTFWESVKHKLLELKLSITCPYFADFKDFLNNLRLWTDTSVWTTTTPTETVGESNETVIHSFYGTNINNIKSEPFEKNSQTWVTRCSKTARCNWKNFGIDLPCWNAYDAWKLPGKNSIATLPKNKIDKRPQKSWDKIEISTFKSITAWNYADIFTESKSNYGHRAAAFRDDSWQRYVLDPYTRVNWKLDNSPKKLEDYLKVKKIVKSHFYKSTWYNDNRSDTHRDKWTWYEWWNN